MVATTNLSWSFPGESISFPDMKSKLLSTTLTIALGFGLLCSVPAEAAAKARAGASGVRSSAIHKGKRAVHTRKKKSHKKRSARVRHSGKAVDEKAQTKSAPRPVSGGDSHPI